MAETRLWFLRHGEVEGRFVGTFLGTTDAPLSPLGRHQAEAVKEYLGAAPVDAIVASPRRRALDSAAPLARRLDLRLDVRAGFAEMDFGAWEGLTWDQVVQRDRGAAEAWERDPAAVPCPGGESCDRFFARVQAALTGLMEEFRGRTVVLAGHAGTSRSVLAHVLGRPYVDCFVFAQDYGCVNAVAWPEGGPAQVALLNFVPGPRARDQGD